MEFADEPEVVDTNDGLSPHGLQYAGSESGCAVEGGVEDGAGDDVEPVFVADFVEEVVVEAWHAEFEAVVVALENEIADSEEFV
jgi:hypothetical protein